MSFIRAAIPVTLAVGMGIWNAQYVFKPAFEEERKKREDQALVESAAQSQAKTTEAKTTVKSSTPQIPSSKS